MNQIRNDIKLVEGLKKNDISCFDDLFEKYSDKLYRFAMHYLKNENEAEEIVQDVFVKVWENRKKLNTELSFKSFIFTIAHNLILKYFRNIAYHQSFVNEQILKKSTESNDESRIEYNFVLQEVNKLIEDLPDKKRIIFVKNKIDGLTSTEIAKQLNLSKSTVDNHISEAIKILKSKAGHLSFTIILFLYLFVI